MLVKTLDNFEYKWILNGAENPNPSNLHLRARELIRRSYPTIITLEEVQIKVKKNKYLYLDFYVPIFKIAVEVNGEQHTKFNIFMNKNPLNFIKQNINDRLKKSWCELNNINLIYLNFNEDDDIWQEKLVGKINNDREKQ